MLFFSKARGLIVTVPGKPDVKFINHRFVTEDPDLIEFLSKSRGVYAGEKPKGLNMPEGSATRGPVRSYTRGKRWKE